MMVMMMIIIILVVQFQLSQLIVCWDGVAFNILSEILVFISLCSSLRHQHFTGCRRCSVFLLLLLRLVNLVHISHCYLVSSGYRVTQLYQCSLPDSQYQIRAKGKHER